jgi:hypothetical protein
MKTTKLFLTLLLLVFAWGSFAQVREQYSVASRKLIFNSAGLVSQGAELQSPLSDSSVAAFSYSQKTMVNFEGVYYQAVNSNKFAGTTSQVAVRKSMDGINWSGLTRVSDAGLDKNEYHSNIYVWRKGGNINVGVVYGFWSAANPNLRYALSTNGGNTFQPSVQLSSHTDNFTIFLGGIAGKGDTIMINWVRQVQPDFCGETWFTRSTNGGVTWSPMAVAFTGNHYSFVTDITMDQNGNAWSVTADDQFFRVNPVIRFTSNLGASWETKTQIVDMPSGHTNTNVHLKSVNNKLYAAWTHTRTFADSVNFSVSTNGGNSWSTKKISDTDTLNPFSQTILTIHPAFSVSDNGNIYAVWSDSRERHNSIDSSHFNVYLTRSTDGGATWSSNMKISGPSNFSRVLNSYPNVAVRSNGAVDTVLVVWDKYRNILGPQAVTQLGNEVPQKFLLEQNYPNPFNPVTNIKVNISSRGFVSLKVFDITGREAAILINEEMNAGVYNVDFNAGSLPSGVYFYRLAANNFSDTKKMILIK